MSEYINKQDAINIFIQRSKQLDGIGGDLGGACSGAGKLIASIPPADVRENVRGEWKDRGKYALGYMCSHCQKASIDKSDFCPNCGARMVKE